MVQVQPVLLIKVLLAAQVVPMLQHTETVAVAVVQVVQVKMETHPQD
jgi:hypothetical protein